MLDIVITHYNEPWEVGEKLFQMLALQRCVNFDLVHVTVVNDGGQRLPEDKLNALPYPVKQIDIPHKGVSAARNTGIENATHKWIMFCDFDDEFPSVYSLREFMNTMGTDDHDMLWSRLLAEHCRDGKLLLYFVPDKQRFVFCHGKLYRTAFLKESGIRFDESLVFNEDSCFNAVIIAHVHHTRIGQITSQMPLYVWVRRDQSVTNSGREDEASYGHFRRNMIVTGEYEGTGDNRYYGMVTRTVYDTYYMVFGKRNSMDMRRRIVDEFTPWIADRIDAFGKVDAKMLDQIREIARAELIEPDELVPDEHKRVEKWVRSLVMVHSKVKG